MRIRSIIASLAAVAVVTIATPATATAPTPTPRAHWMRTACAQEDSTDCTWNADTSGNGQGHSFYSVRRHMVNAHGVTVGRVICVYYVKRADAKRWDACHLLPAGQDGSL